MRKLIIYGIILAILAGAGLFLLLKRPRPNIIIVVVDTLREDLGGANPPFFNSLKRKGIYFKNAFTTIPITLPAHSSLFTSRYPWELGVLNNNMEFKDKTETLAQILKREGYTTMGIVSLGTVQASTGINRGFEYYNDKFPPTRWWRTAGEINEALLPMLNKLKPPFFLWIHYSDPHEPYAPPWVEPDGEVYVNGKKAGDVCFLKKELFFIHGKAGEKVKVTVKLLKPLKNKAFYGVDAGGKRYPLNNPKKREVSFTIKLDDKGVGEIQPRAFLKVAAAHWLYKKEVEYWDSQFKIMYGELKKRGLLKNTYMIILADHGEGLGEWKAHKGHIHFLNALYTRIPLLLLTPNKKTGVRTEFRSIMDVFPTVLKFTRISSPHPVRGISLLDNRGHSRLFLQTFKPEAFFDRYSIIKDNFQLIHTPEKNQFLFFDLASDRPAIHPITFNQHTANMMKLLKQYEEEVKPFIGKREGKMSPARLKMLKSLGYVK